MILVTTSFLSYSTELFEFSSKRLNLFFKNVNNTHLADSDNCLTNNSLCHYIESNSVQKFCIPNNLSNSTNFTSICLNIRSIVNKDHFNVLCA